MPRIDIRGLPKVELLRNLWVGASPAMFFGAHPSLTPGFDYEEAAMAVKEYIDYFCGRCIKTNISGDSAKPKKYDRDAGTGAFQRAVDATRRGDVIGAPAPPTGHRCPDGSGVYREFVPSPRAGEPGLAICRNCPFFLKQHIPFH